MFKGLWAALDDRTGVSRIVGPILRHPVPRGTGWWYVFGSATLTAFIVAVVSGVPLATVYIPSPNDAYASIQFITHSAVFGNQVRGLHAYGAAAMVVLVGVHMARVYLFGSYKYPREVNWLLGVVLLFLTLGIAFTGQLLRWEQDAVWSVVVGAEQAGRAPFIGQWLAQLILAGDTLGGATLSRFFALHVFVIPGLLFVFIGVHLYMVLHTGISDPPKAGRPVDPATYRAWYKDLLKREGVPFWPDVIWRDIVFSVALVLVIVVVTLILGPSELGQRADPTIIKADPKPEWYFLWYFAVFAVIPPAAQNWVIVGAPLALALLLFGLPFLSNKGERSPLRRPWAVGIVLLSVVMISTLLLKGLQEPWVPRTEAGPLPAKVVGASSGPVYRGALLFHSAGCEACHNIWGYGGQRGPNLTNVGNRLTTALLTIRILGGGTNMPAYGSILTPRQVGDLVAFLKTRKAP